MAPASAWRLRTPRTARLVAVGTLDRNTRVVYLACHGSGMDVDRFARRFAELHPRQAALCPEELSRFSTGAASTAHPWHRE